jgi:hypothetical protein
VALSKKQIEYMSLQIAVTTGRANSITPWHEVENLKQFWFKALCRAGDVLLAGDSKHWEDI